MDPTATVDHIRGELERYVVDPAWAPMDLIEAVDALDTWMSEGGALPGQWAGTKTRGRPRRLSDGPVIVDGYPHGKRSTYNKGCRCLECTAANREAGARARARKEAS